MKTSAVAAILAGLLTVHAFGQSSQVLKRARELNNQNNVRQGIPPTTPPPKAAPASPINAKPGTPQPATPQQKIAKIQADLMAFKPGATITTTHKQQLVNDIIATARGTKPSTTVVTTFVDSLSTALADKSLGAAEQEGLAKDIEAVANSAGMPANQLTDIIDHAQAILQVETVKRPVAIEVAKNLREVGKEVRGGK